MTPERSTAATVGWIVFWIVMIASQLWLVALVVWAIIAWFRSKSWNSPPARAADDCDLVETAAALYLAHEFWEHDGGDDK